MDQDTPKRKAYNSGIIQGKAYRVLQNQLAEALAPYDISIPEWKVLGVLSDLGKIKIADVANHLDIESPLVTKWVHKMEQKGLVHKQQDDKDQRKVFLIPSAKGLKLIPELEIVVRRELSCLLYGLTAEEIQTYMKVLVTIIKQGKIESMKKSYLINDI